jgi:HPt (histidine-containing phosphotransfer) domain-containing protein
VPVRAAPAVKASAAQAESAVNFSPLIDAFTPELQASFASLIDSDLSVSGASENFQKARHEVHRIKGAARFAGTPKIEAFFGGFEELLTDLSTRDLATVDELLRKKIQAHCKNGWGLLIEIKSKLGAAKSEDEVLAAESIALLYRDVSSGIDMLKFDLSFVETRKGA